MAPKDLKTAMERSGFQSQTQFALAAKIPSCILSDLLRGRRRITKAYLPRIQRALIKGPLTRKKRRNRKCIEM